MARVVLSVVLASVFGGGIGVAQGIDAAKLAYKETLLRQKASVLPAIATGVTTGVHCIGGTTIEGVPIRPVNVHDLGFIGQGRTLTVNFDSTFDPVAVVVGTQVGQGAPNGVSNLASASDDDSGGDLEPQINVATPFAGSWSLHVGSFNPAAAGCYTFEVIIRTGT